MQNEFMLETYKEQLEEQLKLYQVAVEVLRDSNYTPTQTDICIGELAKMQFGLDIIRRRIIDLEKEIEA